MGYYTTINMDVKFLREIATYLCTSFGMYDNILAIVVLSIYVGYQNNNALINGIKRIDDILHVCTREAIIIE